MFAGRIVACIAFEAVTHALLVELSVNRGKTVWTVVYWWTRSGSLFGLERCPLVGGWFCIIAIGNVVGARTLAQY